MNPIKLYFVDDHQVLIDGIISMLKAEEYLEILGFSLNSVHALSNLKQLKPDIVLTDISMPDANGIDFCKSALRILPDLKIIALSMHDDKQTIEDMLEAGASGYLLKTVGRNELLKAIKEVYANKRYLCEAATEKMNQAVEPGIHQLLTSREKDIVRLVAQGLSHTQIGEKLFISPRTVDTHRNNIMKKLKVNSIAELVKLAMQHRIIT